MRWDKKADPFYRTKAWTKLRRVALMRDAYQCQDCLSEKRAGHMIRVRDATVVHHIISREKRPDLSLELTNLVSLCDACHNKRHPEKGGSREDQERPVTKARVIKV